MAKPGDPIPDLTLPDQDGNPVRVLDEAQHRNVVLYFYPKDQTPGCTREACSFRDEMAKFEELDATILGVSADSAASHRKFRDQHGLPFRLLTDKGLKAAKELGVRRTLGLLPGRTTFVIGKGGTILGVFDSQLRATQHIEYAKEILANA